jgi:glycosyltransferase involved in cell wall biosynthesis
VRVLYATAGSAYPVLFSGGAWRSAHELLIALVGRGVTCAAVAADPSADAAASVLHCGYPVTFHRQLFPVLDAALEEFRPDVVCTHLQGAIEVVRRAARFGARPAWFIRNGDCTDHPQAQLDEARASNSLFLASCPSLARHLEAEHGIPTVPLYSAVDVARYRVPLDPAGAITMVNPTEQKGLLTLIGLVLRLPHRPFLLVEGWKGDRDWQQIERTLGRLPNVRLSPAVEDMREIYRQTRLLIVPSRWKEGFGRVTAEAHASGIPVIASKIGGLADLAAGTVLIDDFLDPDPWVEAIEGLYQDQALYQRLSRAALAYTDVAPYRAEQVAARLLRVIAAAGSRRPAGHALTPPPV